MDGKVIDFSLNAKNLKDIPFGMYENNFTFHVDGKSYKTNRFIADLLSPYVRQMHFTDRTNDEFSINTKDQRDQTQSPTEDYFQDFLKLVTFEEIKIDQKRQQHYKNYFYALGNFEEFLHIQQEYFGDVNEDNCLDRILLLSNIHFTSNSNDALIDFISSHFDEIDKEKMKLLNYDIIESIIDNKNLKLKEEDSLLKFILELYQNDHSYAPLFEFVLFNNASKEMIENFINNFDVEYINNGIWMSISKRLIPVENNDFTRYTEDHKCLVFEHKSGDEFNGIMKYLTNEAGGNIHDKGTIEITSNTNISGSPKNLVDYQNVNSYYQSNDKDGHGYIRFDFKDKSINLTNYTIRSNRNGTSEKSWNLKNWVIEVSNNGENWEEIDRHENDSTLNGANIVHTFDVQKPSKKLYRYVQLRQTGDSWNEPNNKCFWFVLIEFYGKLKKPENKTN